MADSLRRSGLEVDLHVLAEDDDPGRLAAAAAEKEINAIGRLMRD